MATLYVLAHFDDEYFAYPLIREAQRQGLDQRFIYVCGYANAELTGRRRAETLRLLESLGVTPDRVTLLTGDFPDGGLHTRLPDAYQALRRAAADLAPIERIVVSAWEGGHPDHDACAAVAVALAGELGAIPVDQVSLYNAGRLPAPLFRAGSPLPQNGPLQRAEMRLSDWFAFAAAVRFFPSQWKTWMGLWPVMWVSYLLRGYAYQALDPVRVAQRPHPGPLLYERRFKVGYEDVQARAGMITRTPASIST